VVKHLHVGEYFVQELGLILRRMDHTSMT
jgi:hypothetical protein